METQNIIKQVVQNIMKHQVVQNKMKHQVVQNNFREENIVDNSKKSVYQKSKKEKRKLSDLLKKAIDQYGNHQ